MLFCCSSSLSNGTVMTVSPAKPSYLEYHIPQGVWSVVVRAQSDDDLCGVLSVQDVKVLHSLFYTAGLHCLRTLYRSAVFVTDICIESELLWTVWNQIIMEASDCSVN